MHLCALFMKLIKLETFRKFNRIRRRKNTYKIILASTDLCIARNAHKNHISELISF